MKVRILLLGILVLALSCSKKVLLNVTKPAQYDVSDLKRIAVVDFKGPRHVGSTVGQKFQERLWKTQFFSILERQELKQILDEHALQMSGIVNDSTAVEFGKILGVDGIVFGDVFTYTVKDVRGTEKIKEKVWTGEYETDKSGKVITEKVGGKKQKKKKYKEEMVSRKTIQRNISVGVNFRLVSIETGEIRATESRSRSFSKKYFPHKDKLPDKNQILNKLTDEILASFVPLLSPHQVSISKTFEEDNDQVDLGIEMAQKNLWDKAMDIWQKEADTDPLNSAAVYNLGIAYEAYGDLDKAEEMYERALEIEPKDDYMDALSHIRKRQAEQQKLDKQLKH
jgi:curli biogenesis system outer membrane secretion channel CsgG